MYPAHLRLNQAAGFAHQSRWQKFTDVRQKTVLLIYPYPFKTLVKTFNYFTLETLKEPFSKCYRLLNYFEQITSEEDKARRHSEE
jgi:hypothetical protein